MSCEGRGIATTRSTVLGVLSYVKLIFKWDRTDGGTRYNTEGRWFDSRWRHWNFLLTYSFRPHYDPAVDSASKRNEYQDYFLTVKTASAYHFHVPIVLKSGSLNLLEPSGPVQACNGIAFFTGQTS